MSFAKRQRIFGYANLTVIPWKIQVNIKLGRLLYTQHLCWGVYSFHLPICPFVCSFICSFVHPSHSWNLWQKFFTELRESFSSGVYLKNHSSESIHIWTIGTLEGGLSFHDSWPQGPCPRVGLEVKIEDTFKKYLFYFSVMETTYADSLSDMV